MLLYTCAFTQRYFSQRHAFLQTLTRTDAFTQRCFYAQLPLLTGASIQGFFYTEQLLRTDTQVLLHTDAFTQQCFYTHVLYTGSLVTQSILYTEKTFAQVLLHGDVKCFFSHKYIYTQAFFTHRYSADTSTKRCFARILLHRDAFTHRRF